MHHKSLALALMVAMAVAFAMPAIAAENPFPDVPADHWAYDAVTGLAAAGLIEGFPDGTFGGDRSFTRYEMAMVFSRILSKMEKLLISEIDQRIVEKSSGLEEQIAAAATQAKEALAAAIVADSKAAYAQQQAAAANALAEKALALAQNLEDIVNQLEAKAAETRAQADFAAAQAAAASATAYDAAINAAAALEAAAAAADAAGKAAFLAQQAYDLAINGQVLSPTIDLSEYEKAVQEAKDAAARAEQLAKAAATPADVAAAQAAADAAAQAAARAEALAAAAARMADVAAAMARAEEAYAKAVAAEALAQQALGKEGPAPVITTIPGGFELTDEAKKAISRYVAEELQKELADIEANAAALAQRVTALEQKAISAAEAEAIAEKVVSERLASALGRITSLENALAATNGDVAATKALIDEKVSSIASDVAALEAEFRPEIDELRAKLADLQNALDALTAKQSRFEVEQKEAVQQLGARVDELKTDAARIQAQLDETNKMADAAGRDIAAMQADLTAQKKAIDDIDSRLDNTSAAVDLTNGRIDTLANEVFDLRYVDLEKVNKDIAALQGEVQSLQDQINAHDELLTPAWESINAILGMIQEQELTLVELQKKAGNTQAEVDDLTKRVAALESAVQANNAAIAANAAAIEGNKQSIAALDDKFTTGTNALSGQIGSLADTLAPIKEKLATSEASLRTELVITNMNGKAAYTNARELNFKASQRAATADWYNESLFLKDEAKAVYSLNLSSIPVLGIGGNQLSGRAWVAKDLLNPGAYDAGIDMDLRTSGTLRSVHVGALETGVSGFSLQGFNSRVLSGTKWDALMWRPGGVQADIDAKLQASLILGTGTARRISPVDMNPITSSPDSDDAQFGAATVNAPFADLFKVRANWLNLGGTIVNALPTPVNVSSLEVYGESELTNYNAVIARKGDTGALNGAIQVSRLFGQPGVDEEGRSKAVKVLAEYGCTEPNWKNPTAAPEVAAALEGQLEQYLGLEISGIRLLDFDTILTERSVSNYNGQRTTLLINARRTLKLVLPLTATVEYGLNDDAKSAADYQHFMIDLSVVDYKMAKDRVTITAGYALEQNPIEAEDWDKRWRNTNTVDAFWAPGQVQLGRNWAVSAIDPLTMRQAVKAQVEWLFAKGDDGNTGASIFMDYNQEQDTLSTKAIVKDERVFGLGLKADFTIKDTVFNTVYEWQSAKGALKPKESLTFGFAREIGAGSFSGSAVCAWGQGNEVANVGTVDADVKLQLPVFAAAMFNVETGYSRLLGTVADDFTAYTVQTGITMRF